MQYSVLPALALAMMAKAAPNPNPNPQGPFPSYTYKTFEADEPNPHQVYFYQQVTTGHTCGGGEDGGVECAVGKEDATSYGVTFGADISGAGWVSAGFSVSKEVSTGEVKECSNKRTDGDGNESLATKVCIWKRVGHTEYTVQDWKRFGHDGDWEEDSEQYQMWSPNSDYDPMTVCAWDDECEEEGAEWWGPSREPGEPTDYPFDDRWQ